MQVRSDVWIEQLALGVPAFQDVAGAWRRATEVDWLTC
jgi:hypothetical protein